MIQLDSESTSGFEQLPAHIDVHPLSGNEDHEYSQARLPYT